MPHQPSVPLYSQIRQYILDQIASGVWPSEYQIPPERELAEQFSVSRITAKNAVLRLVNEGYLYRHRGKGTFVSGSKPLSSPLLSPKPPKLESKRNSKLIGFVIPWMEMNYSTLLFGGLESALGERGYHVVFKRIPTPEQESKAIRELLELPVAGLVVVSSQGEHFNEDLVRLALDKYPLVLVEKAMRDVKTSGVYCDTERAGARLARYLANRGLERIGLLAYPSTFTYGVKERIFGFQAELARRGIPPLPEGRILIGSPDWLGPQGQSDNNRVPREIYRYLELNPDLQAIAAADALLARYVGIACRQAGRLGTVIVCFDAPYAHPGAVLPAAYIDQSPFDMGLHAAALIVDALEGKSDARQIVIEPKLVEVG